MPELTAERVRALLDYDPITGTLTWRVNRGGRKNGAVAGHITPRGYLRVGIDGKLHQAHRIVWLIAYGRWPAQHIDHINGARDDNRLANLRDVSNTTNTENQRNPSVNNHSGFLGVHWQARNKRFKAQIMVNGKKVHLGYHETPSAAHAAYLIAKRQLHAGNTI